MLDCVYLGTRCLQAWYIQLLDVQQFHYFIIIIIIIISYRFLNVEVLPVELSNSEYHFSAVFSNMYLRNKKMYIRDITKSCVWFENMLITS